MTTTARATLQHEDERLRVTRWDFEPQESTGRHVHAYDYLVVPVTDGQTDVITPDGTVTTSQLRAGESYARPVGAEHEVVNSGTSALAFVEIELKQPAPEGPVIG
ncbi:cupin domain-containing protein [Streptomyces sp. NPDC058122]|uniref:cupin domain-containing protein n=1 Tax=Streptomyces sp. NPDC058122 TaxID=3346349 RepID=UPI0036DFD70E